MPRAIFGVLIECDPLIKSGIVEIDKKRNDIIVEDIDDEHLVIKENMVDYLKAQLDVVRFFPFFFRCHIVSHRLIVSVLTGCHFPPCRNLRTLRLVTAGRERARARRTTVRYDVLLDQ
ncbi:hypothetical protein RB595_002293 [Gaeumannomyces hyphopodioides]